MKRGFAALEKAKLEGREPEQFYGIFRCRYARRDETTPWVLRHRKK